MPVEGIRMRAWPSAVAGSIALLALAGCGGGSGVHAAQVKDPSSSASDSPTALSSSTSASATATSGRAVGVLQRLHGTAQQLVGPATVSHNSAPVTRAVAEAQALGNGH